jgi:hypothetical protein
VLQTLDVMSCNSYKNRFDVYLTLFDGLFHGRLDGGYGFGHVGDHSARNATLAWGFAHAQNVDFAVFSHLTHNRAHFGGSDVESYDDIVIDSHIFL